MESPVTATQRIAAGIAAGLVAVFIVCAVLFFNVGAPLRSAYQSVVPGDAYFLQSWRLFAPNITRENLDLSMQARWYDEGELREGPWVSITDLELGSVREDPVPGRVGKTSRYVVNDVISALTRLDGAQRDAALDDTTALTHAELERALGDGNGVAAYLRQDRSLVEYSTLVLLSADAAGPADAVREVRWRVTHQQINDENRRFESEWQYAAVVTVFGWRAVEHDVDPRAVESFRDVRERYGRD